MFLFHGQNFMAAHKMQSYFAFVLIIVNLINFLYTSRFLIWVTFFLSPFSAPHHFLHETVELKEVEAIVHLVLGWSYFSVSWDQFLSYRGSFLAPLCRSYHLLLLSIPCGLSTAFSWGLSNPPLHSGTRSECSLPPSSIPSGLSAGFSRDVLICDHQLCLFAELAGLELDSFSQVFFSLLTNCTQS